MAVSAISLALADSPARNRPQDWEALVYRALESGINSFEVVGRHPNIGEGLARAIHAVDRCLVCVSWRMGNGVDDRGRSMRDFSPAGLERMTLSILARTGLDYLDAIVLEEPRARELSAEALEQLKALRAAGRVRLVGLAGEDEAIDGYIDSGAFNLLCSPFSLVSGWKDRARQHAAADQHMAVMANSFYPERLRRDKAALSVKGPPSNGRKAAHPLADAGTYAFLDKTPGWTAEAICLAYALTNPAVASVQVVTDRPEHLADLAAVTEMDLPPGVAAQIEMARFGAAAKAR